MGWAQNDGKVVEDATVQLSVLRKVMYSAMRDLSNTLNKIEHPEKGPELRRICSEINKNLDAIEIHLGR